MWQDLRDRLWSIPLRDEETAFSYISPNRNMNLRSLQAVWNLDITPVWVTVRSGVEVDCLWPRRRCSKSSVKSHDLKMTIRPASSIQYLYSQHFKAHRTWSSVQIRQSFIYWLNPHTYAAHFKVFSGSWWNLIKASFTCRKAPQCSMNLTILAAMNPVGPPPSGISRSTNAFAFNYKIKKDQENTMTTTAL